jgi:phosphate starvation-inducible PhoH-like protein
MVVNVGELITLAISLQQVINHESILMQKKKATSSSKAAPPRKERTEEPKGPLLEKNDFKTIKFTHSQLNFFKTIKNNFLTVCTGPAGTAKTFVACYAALDLLRDGSHKKIILARPAVEAGENLGFLPGTIDEKIAPYMEGYTSNMEKILTSSDKLKTLLSSKAIDMQPLAFMRSRTFDDTILILDEAQNADLRHDLLKELLQVYVDTKLIDLPSEDYDKFINYLHLSDETLNTITQYELALYVKEMYERFYR